MAKVEAVAKQEGKVVASMLKDYEGLVKGTSALAYAFIKKHKAVVYRDIEATLKVGFAKGEVSGIKHTYAKQFSLAGYVLELGFAYPENVSEFMISVEVFQRAFGKDVAIEKASGCKSWKDFDALGRSTAKKKKSAKDHAKALKGMTGASQGNAEGERAKGSRVLPVEIMAGELVIPDSIAGVATLGMALRFFAKRMNAAIDISLDDEEKVLALEVSKRLACIAKTSTNTAKESSKAKHPAKGSKSVADTVKALA